MNNLYIIPQKSHHLSQKEDRVVLDTYIRIFKSKIKSLENIYLNQKNKFLYSQSVNVSNRSIIQVLFLKTFAFVLFYEYKFTLK